LIWITAGHRPIDIDFCAGRRREGRSWLAGPDVSANQPALSEMMERLGIEPGAGVVPRLSLS
jgi:hypothetical protein